MTLKKSLAAVALAAFVIAPLAARDRYEEKFERTEALAKDGRVYLRNISGTIEVRGWNKDEVKIDAVKYSEARSEATAKENAAEVKIEVTREGSTLRIETVYPHRNHFWGDNNLNVSVDFKLWVPEKAAVEVHSVSGDVDAESVGGALKIDSVSGEVVARGAGAGAEIKLVSGDIDASGIAGDAFLKTVSGDVRVSKVRGSIEAETISGELELTDVADARSVNAKTLSGNCVLTGRLVPQGRYTLKSHSGDVRLTIPADSAFEFEAESFSGTIDTDFEIQVSGKMSPREIRGTVKGGGAYVRMTTFSGSIELRKN